MIAVLLSPIYIIANVYIVKWLMKWTIACSELFKSSVARYIVIAIYIFFASSFIIGFFLPFRTIKIIGNYWLGVVQYILFVVLMADLIRIILLKTNIVSNAILSSNKTFVIAGIICILLVTFFSTYGVIHAKKIVYSTYDVKVDKEVDKFNDLKIALVSDLHLGYNSTLSHINKMVDMINKSNPDLVVLDGDIFDNDYKAIKNPNKIIMALKKIKSKYGVYAVYGNHDIDEELLAGFTFFSKDDFKLIDPEMERFLKKARVKLIRDNSVLIDDSFYLVGRLDYHKYGIKVNKRKSINELLSDVDKNKPIIVMDHEPYELEKLANNGVDIDLSGHTHAGQMLPSSVFVGLVWKNPYGLLKVNDMYSIVTSGIGVYGPNMRVGTTAEVALVNVHFK